MKISPEELADGRVGGSVKIFGSFAMGVYQTESDLHHSFIATRHVSRDKRIKKEHLLINDLCSITDLPCSLICLVNRYTFQMPIKGWRPESASSESEVVVSDIMSTDRSIRRKPPSSVY